MAKVKRITIGVRKELPTFTIANSFIIKPLTIKKVGNSLRKYFFVQFLYISYISITFVQQTLKTCSEQRYYTLQKRVLKQGNSNLKFVKENTHSLNKCVRKFGEYVTLPTVIHPSDYKEEDGKRYLPLYMTPLL